MEVIVLQFNQNPQEKNEHRRHKNIKQVILYWLISSAILFVILYLIFRAIFT